MNSARAIEIAENRLAAGKNCLESGFAPDTINRAYYAAFWAVRAVLSEAEEPWAKTHQGLAAQFASHCKKTGHFDQTAAAKLLRLRNDRMLADYRGDPLSIEAAQDAIQSASDFVAEAKRVIKRRRIAGTGISGANKRGA
ncbi:MAG: HEPN domain-containing protein [Gammaproteobacteria bacterium]|nr:HEPN domain-containing protein [Gammaproteobacteria bacterium]MCY4341830.1 HEPN domain-containing protein [Gammaproteobacteria bacterium]